MCIIFFTRELTLAMYMYILQVHLNALYSQHGAGILGHLQISVMHIISYAHMFCFSVVCASYMV